MSDNESSLEPGLGLFFGIIEYNKRPKILWSGSTWHAEINTWDLLLKILAMDDKKTLEEVPWNFLPIIWDDIEIFALTRLFQISVGKAYMVIFHQSAEKLTQFLLHHEENLNQTFEGILEIMYLGKQLSNEQLKQIRIESQKYYEILSEI
ncbi:MAG: hypothetical protein ACFE95_06590 [Candidatus Hodarchaeota archaeon]